MLCHQSTSVISDSSFKRKQFPAVRIFSGEICKLVETARVQDSDALVMGMCHCGNDFGLKICRCYATFCNFCSCALTSDESFVLLAVRIDTSCLQVLLAR